MTKKEKEISEVILKRILEGELVKGRLGSKLFTFTRNKNIIYYSIREYNKKEVINKCNVDNIKLILKNEIGFF